MRDYDRNHDTMTRDRHYQGRDRDRMMNRERDDNDGGIFSSTDDHPRYYMPQTIRGSDDRDEERNRGWFSDRSREEGRNYGPDQHRRGIARDETSKLIASDKVEGTPVYGRDREKLGSIHNFMVGKRSGKVEYAVLKTSEGFLGLDERYFPLKWDELTYDTRVDGYHVDMTKDDLDRRRSFDSRGRENGMNRERQYGRSDYGRNDRNDYSRGGYGRRSEWRDNDDRQRSWF